MQPICRQMLFWAIHDSQHFDVGLVLAVALLGMGTNLTTSWLEKDGLFRYLLKDFARDIGMIN